MYRRSLFGDIFTLFDKEMKQLFSILVTLSLVLSACDKNEDFNEKNQAAPASLKGSGNFVFDDYAPLSNKPLRVFYHVPDGVNQFGPILMVFHGGNRDAEESRDELIDQSDREGIIVIVPEFSTTYFPGGDAYNLGSVFDDGDNPSSASLNPESEWTFSYVEPLFDKVKALTLNNNERYLAFGFSAGAQFLHRFLLFKPDARVERSVAAAAGWYTMPDTQIDFPYGVQEAPIDQLDLNTFFARELVVLVGENDDDPNAPSLRRNTQADQQGDNRFDRGAYFVDQSRMIANASSLPFDWRFQNLPGVGHNFQALANYAIPNIFAN